MLHQDQLEGADLFGEALLLVFQLLDDLQREGGHGRE